MAKKLQTILKSMTTRSPSIVDDMFNYIDAEGLPDEDLLDIFFGEDTLPRTVNEWMADTAIQDYLASCLTTRENRRNAKASGQRFWFYKDQPRSELVEQSVEVVKANFIFTRDNLDGFTDYSIINHETKVVQPLLVSKEDRLRDITTSLAPILDADGYLINSGEAKIIWDYATAHGKTYTTKPKLCAQPDHAGYCIHRISTVPKAGAMPVTQSLLDRINDPEAFAAWLYGVYSDRYQGRQVLWLKGDGSDGKSTFFKAFSSLFGVTAGAIDWNSLKNNASFSGSLFVNKRFVYVPDNNNPELLSTGLFKSLSDPKSDPVVINHKYGKMYSTELEAHTAVLSNFEPSVRGQAHSLTRCLYLTVSQRDMSTTDKGITDKFIAELPAFLAYGQECYERLCDNNTVISTNELVQKEIDDRRYATNEHWSVVFNRLFVLDEAAKLSSSEAYELLIAEGVKSFDIADFKAWLKAEHGVAWGQERGNGQRFYYGIRRRTAQDQKSNVLPFAKGDVL